MPCDDGSRGGHSVEYVDRPETIKSLCDACRTLEAAGLLGRVSERTQRWWKAHKQADAAREQADRERVAKRKKREAVLAKLSKEERRILGVKE
jgi:hypothetical protein